MCKTNPTFRNIKNEIIRIAEQLCYGKDVTTKLEYAETESQLMRIMYDARHGIY